MDKDFKLDDQIHEQIYRKIETDLFENTHSAGHPRVVILGGQPGSGKSKLLEASRELFPDGNVVVINGDELREYHPKSDDIFKLDDKRYAERTDADSRVWTKRVFDRAIETKRNIIFESTMREPGPISDTMKRLRDEGYELSAKIVATNERMSTTGIYIRYEGQKAVKGHGRFTSQDSHDAGYAGMPKTVEYIDNNKLIDRLDVYNRDSEPLLTKRLQSDGEWDRAESAVDVIERERSRPLTERETESLRQTWEKILDYMEERKAPAREMEEARKVHERVVNVTRIHDRDKNPNKLKAQDVFKIKPKDKPKERDRDDDLTR